MKCKKSIAELIGRTLKIPSLNKDKEDEEEEEDVVTHIASTEDDSPGDKETEGREDDQEDDRIYDHKDTVLYDTRDNDEEDS